MRLKGKLISWDAQKAFGFIQPHNQSKQVFIHKSAFQNRQREPQINDIITFSKTVDKTGRTCASSATFSGERLKPAQVAISRRFSLYISVLFLSGIFVAFIMDRLAINVLLFYGGMSFFTFLLYALDKHKAQKGLWRTPENTLHAFAVFGGWPGAGIAQPLLRHKTQKKPFTFIFCLTVVINILSLAWLLMNSGKDFFNVF